MNEFKDRYKEESEYSITRLVNNIKKLEKELQNSSKQEEVRKSDLIIKIQNINEIIRLYKSLKMLTENEEDYSETIQEYVEKREEFQEELDKMKQMDMRDLDEEKSWNEFREEEEKEETEK